MGTRLICTGQLGGCQRDKVWQQRQAKLLHKLQPWFIDNRVNLNIVAQIAGISPPSPLEKRECCLLCNIFRLGLV